MIADILPKSSARRLRYLARGRKHGTACRADGRQVRGAHVVFALFVIGASINCVGRALLPFRGNEAHS
jgi:hypothetical protein